MQDLLSFQPDECTNTIVTTKVLHSQRLNDTPLKPWAIIGYFCLEKLDGKLQLKKHHPYYTQAQTQIFVTHLKYCDFVLWTQKECAVVRILPDAKLWSALLKKEQQFFNCVCLPELVSKYFTLVRRQEILQEITAPGGTQVKTCQTTDTTTNSRKKF